MPSIDFYFDFVSPYAYLANCRLPALAEQYGYTLNYLPIDLMAAKHAAGNTGPASVQIPPKFRYVTCDLARWAKKYGVPFLPPFPRKPGPAPAEPPKKIEIPKEWLDSSRAHKGLYFAREQGQERAYVDLVFQKTFGSGGLAGDDSILRAVAEQLGWDVDGFVGYVTSAQADEAYAAANQAAHERGVFGVPTMMIGEEMWWGNDRLGMLEEYLQQHPAG